MKKDKIYKLIVVITVVILVFFLVYYLTKKPNKKYEVVSDTTGQSSQYQKSVQPATQPIKEETISFQKDSLWTVLPVLKQRKLYYVKNGDIWTADIKQNKIINPQKILDLEKNILLFDISNDEAWLAYSIKQYKSANMDIIDARGDTIMIKNLQEGSEFEIYTDKDVKTTDLYSILFSPDSRKLLFSHNFVWIFNLDTKKIDKLSTTKTKNQCGSVYSLQDISPDGQHVLAFYLCYEGGYNVVLDIQSGKIETDFDYQYFDHGTGVVGFINNKMLLGYNYEGELELPWTTINIYNITGEINKTLIKKDMPFSFFNNGSSEANVYFGLDHSNDNFLDWRSMYELNRENYELNKISEAKNLIVRQYDGIDKESIWVTDNQLENPFLFEKIDADTKIGQLVLR